MEPYKYNFKKYNFKKYNFNKSNLDFIQDQQFVEAIVLKTKHISCRDL